VPFGGGTSVIAAVAIDASNNPLVGIPVTFSTSTGATIAPATLKTDPKGLAEATLTANARVTVTATAAAAPSDPGFGAVGSTQGSVVVSALPQPVPVVTVVAPPNAAAGTPVPFTIGAVPAPGSNTTVTNVLVDFGDGGRVNLGAGGPAITVQHLYATGGSYTVTVTATDSAGGTSTAATVIVVGFAPPSTVRITLDGIVKVGTNGPWIATLTANISGRSATARRRPRSIRCRTPTPSLDRYGSPWTSLWPEAARSGGRRRSSFSSPDLDACGALPHDTRYMRPAIAARFLRSFAGILAAILSLGALPSAQAPTEKGRLGRFASLVALFRKYGAQYSLLIQRRELTRTGAGGR
jgi:hypothetical protein